MIYIQLPEVTLMAATVFFLLFISPFTCHCQSDGGRITVWYSALMVTIEQLTSIHPRIGLSYRTAASCCQAWKTNDSIIQPSQQVCRIWTTLFNHATN